MIARKWVISALVFIVAAAVSFSIVTRGSEGESPVSAAARPAENAITGGVPLDASPEVSTAGESGYEGFQASSLRMLFELHDRMVRDDLPLLEATMERVDRANGSITVSLSSIQPIWTPTGSDRTPLPVLKADWTAPTDDLDMIKLPAEVIVVVSGRDEIIGLAVFGPDASELLAPGAGPLFLADAAEQLFERQIDPTPGPASTCEGPKAPVAYSSPRDALESYFTVLGDSTTNTYRNTDTFIERTSERMVLDTSDLVDPVTGWALAPSQQDIVYQLEEGKTEAEVTIRPALPVQVRVATDVNGEDGLIAVFVAEPAGRVLGFTVLAPHVAYDNAGNATPVLDRVVELVPLEFGEEMAVYVRSTEGRFECPQGSDEEPIMRIPYDIAAGSDSRVSINLGDSSYESVTEIRAPSIDQ